MGHDIHEPSPARRADWLAGGAAALVGLLMSVLPHLIAWQQTGQSVWFDDYDDFSVYSLMGAQAYHNHPWHLADPVRADGSATYYSSLACAPGVVVARALDLGPLRVNMAWRALGGLAGGLLWYVLLRTFVSRPAVAFGLAVLFLTDGGVNQGQLLYVQTKAVVGLLAHPGGPPAEQARVLDQWRILNPSLSLPWCLFYLWQLARALKAPGGWRTAAAGVAFGLLFYAYFYLWTAAGLGLLVAMALDPRRWKTYLAVGWVGLLVGLPALWHSYSFRQTYNSDWMLRSDKFLPVGHFAELLLPRVTFAVGAVCVVWVLWRRRDLAYLASLVLAGLFLLDQQVVTGLQLENWHWKLVLGPSLTLLSLLLVLGFLARKASASTFRAVLLWSVVAAVAVSGVWLRVREATRPGEPVRIAEAVKKYLAQRAGEGPRLRGNAVVAGDPYFVEAASIVDNTRPLDGYVVVLSGTVDNAEWDARLALNAYLSGLSRDEFVAQQRTWFDKAVWGPWAPGRKNDAARVQRLRSRLASWDAIAADPQAALDRFQVRYVALPVAARTDHLADGWALVQGGPDWQVWQRAATIAEAP